ncbi:hypothetical protein E2C05_31680, partial [Paracraurococcus ruber]|uniref:chemotaxis protein CheW n=1 Tax=Paracraurococcus ruber TaxID=77675 RepID=UPI00186522EA
APPPPGAPPGVLGLCAHRGDVLPVVDAMARLGLGAAAAAERPLLRLALQPPVAIAIDALPALHRLPEADFTPVMAPDGLVESLATLDGAPLPVCRPAVLGRLRPDAAGGAA